MNNSIRVAAAVLASIILFLGASIIYGVVTKSNNQAETPVSGESSEIISEESEDSSGIFSDVASEDFSLSIEINESEDSSESNISEEELSSSESSDCIESSEDTYSSENIEDSESSEDTGKFLSGYTDIIYNIPVKLYNAYNTGYNQVDGRAYIEDIAALLIKHAPVGLRISSACAMAYTEGGSGKTGVYSATNNCFGIRATPTWSGWVYSRTTGAVYKDYTTARHYGAQDLFRAYPNIEASVVDYINLLSNERYDGIFDVTTDAEYFNFLLNRGYGEKHMKNTWLSIVALYDLTQYNITYTEDLY